MKRIVSRVLIIAIPFLILLVTVNLMVDPANLFTDKYTSEIAAYMLKGYNVTRVGNCDERQLQKEWIGGFTKCPDMMVLGSSKSLLINSSSFPGKGFVNNSVSGASIEDYLAIYNLYVKKGFQPRSIIINVDPYILNANNNQTRWKSLAGDYNESLGRMGLEDYFSERDLLVTKTMFSINKFMEILSPDYFQQSVQNSIKGGRVGIVPTKNGDNVYFTRMVDGSISYDRQHISRTSLEVESEIKSSIKSQPVYSLGDFEVLDETRCKIFESFIEQLANDSVKITFFYSPHHPLIYQHLVGNKKYTNFFLAEAFFKELQIKYNITAVGHYDPSLSGLVSADFYDALHPSKEVIEQLFAR